MLLGQQIVAGLSGPVLLQAAGMLGWVGPACSSSFVNQWLLEICSSSGTHRSSWGQVKLMEGSSHRTSANIPLAEAKSRGRTQLWNWAVHSTHSGRTCKVTRCSQVSENLLYVLCYSASLFVHLRPHDCSSRSAGIDLTGSSEYLNQIPSYKHTTVYPPFHYWCMFILSGVFFFFFASNIL